MAQAQAFNPDGSPNAALNSYRRRATYRKHSAEANARKSEVMRAVFATWTPEQRRERGRKIWESRKRNAGLGSVIFRRSLGRWDVLCRDGSRTLWARVVMEGELGRELARSEVVHHIDFDPTNDDPVNLAVMTRSEHMRLHAKLRRED